MKRPAVCLFIWVACAGWAAGGQAWAKKGGGKPAGPAPAAAAPEEKAAPAAPADENAAPADSGQAAPSGGEAAGGESLEGAEEKIKLEGDEPEAKPRALTTLSWRDIVVVPRKAFLKGGRFEVGPFSGVSVNDLLVRHFMFGVDLNYFLTDVLWVGLQGQYFIKTMTEREELVGLQYNRIPTLNRYLYGGALNFGYVPVYGKFAWVNRSILHWEIYASAGVGLTVSEIIPRNPGNEAFKNNLITPNVGLGSRFFFSDWLTVNFALRDYILPDKFEPQDRVPDGTLDANGLLWNVDVAKQRADSALVNNVMFYVGIGLYLPTKFQYRAPR